MSPQQFEELFNSFTAQLAEIYATKGREYSGEVDRLANFKRHAVDGRNMVDVWDIYQSKHEDSIRTFISDLQKIMKDQTLNKLQRDKAIGALFANLSEPIEERIKDKVAYLILFLGMLQEIKQNAKENIEAHS